MNDIYNVPNKASLKQVISSRLHLIEDELCRNAREKLDLLADKVRLEVEYKEEVSKEKEAKDE